MTTAASLRRAVWIGLTAFAVVVVLGLHQGRASAQTAPPTTLVSVSTSVPVTIPSSPAATPTPTTLPATSGSTGSGVAIIDDCTCVGPQRPSRDRRGSAIGVPDVDDLIAEVQDDIAAIADRIFTKPPTEPAIGTTRPPVDTTTNTSRPPVDLCTAPPTTRPPFVALAAQAVGTGSGAGGASGSATTCTPVDDRGGGPETPPIASEPVPVPVVSPVAPLPAPPVPAPVAVLPVPPVAPAVSPPVDAPPAGDTPAPRATPPPVLFVAAALPPVPLMLPLPPQDPLPEVAFVDLVVPPPPVPSSPALVPAEDVRPVPVLRPLVVRGIGPGRPSALAGGRAEATGLDCPTGAAVTLRVEGRDVARTTADAAGMFQVALDLPSDLQAGRRLVSASCGPVTLEGPLQLVQTSSNSNPGAGVTTLAALLSLFLLIVLLLRTTQNDRRPVQ